MKLPTLLAQGHLVCSASNKRSLEDPDLKAHWEGRVHNGKFKLIDFRERVGINDSILSVQVYHSGADVYLLLFLAASLFLLAVRVGKGIVGAPTTPQSLFLTVLALIAFSTAEILTDLTKIYGAPQPIVSVLVLIAYASIVIFSLLRGWNTSPKLFAKTDGYVANLSDGFPSSQAVSNSLAKLIPQMTEQEEKGKTSQPAVRKRRAKAIDPAL